MKFPEASDKMIHDRVGSFLAQAGDREGGRRNRPVKEASQPESAAAVNDQPAADSDVIADTHTAPATVSAVSANIRTEV